MTTDSPGTDLGVPVHGLTGLAGVQQGDAQWRFQDDNQVAGV
jgi:hypothetical protein